MATLLTVASTGADHTTIAAAVAAINAIGGGPTDDYIVRVTEAYNAQSTTLDLTITTPNGHSFTLEGASGVRPNAFSRAEANACARIVVSAGAAITNAYAWTIQGLAIETTATGQQAISGDFSTIKRCILIALDSFALIQGANCVCENTVIYSGASGWMQTNNTATLWQVSLYHAGGFGFWGNGGNFATKNCAAQGGGFGDYVGVTDTDCISEDATATDYPSETGIFEDVGATTWDLAATFANGDFPGGDAAAFDADMATDMAGTARTSTPDAGAMQPSGSPPTPPDLTYANFSIGFGVAGGPITPTNGGDPATICTVDTTGGKPPLPDGFTLNNDGSITIDEGAEDLGDVGTRTCYINNSNAGGSGTQATVQITITNDPPDASYADFSIGCEAAGGPITPTNVGGAIDTATLDAGSDPLPTGFALNAATGAITITAASMVAGDIGTHNILINLSGPQGDDAGNPVPLTITITANPPVYTFPIIDQIISAGSVNNDPTHTSGPAAVAGSWASAALPAGCTAINATTGRIVANPTQDQWFRRAGYAVTFASAGGQVGTTDVTIEFYGKRLVTGTNAGGSDPFYIEMRVGSGGGGGVGVIKIGDKVYDVMLIERGGLRMTYNLGNQNR